MPHSVSKSQQKAAGMALAARRGEIEPDMLKGAAESMFLSMTIKNLEQLSGTKHKGLPEKKKKKK